MIERDTIRLQKAISVGDIGPIKSLTLWSHSISTMIKDKGEVPKPTIDMAM